MYNLVTKLQLISKIYFLYVLKLGLKVVYDFFHVLHIIVLIIIAMKFIKHLLREV